MYKVLTSLLLLLISNGTNTKYYSNSTRFNAIKDANAAKTTWIIDQAETILNECKADRAVCLMDIPDDWNMEFQIEKYREIFNRAIEFAKKYPDTLWCYGNHNVSYPWGRLETGYSPYAERTVMTGLEEFTVDFLRRLNAELLDADIDEVVAPSL